MVIGSHIQRLTPTMASALNEMACGTLYTWEDGDRRTMRALERRGCARYVRSRDQWTITAAGRQALALHIEMERGLA